MGSFRFVAHTDEIRGPNLSELFVNFKIGIGEKGKGDIISFSEVVDLKGRVAGTDSD